MGIWAIDTCSIDGASSLEHDRGICRLVSCCSISISASYVLLTDVYQTAKTVALKSPPLPLLDPKLHN
jgi:hypothetical protein